jgi:hypothetical protein
LTKIIKSLFIIALTTFLLLETSLQLAYYVIAREPLYTRFAVPIYVKDEIRGHALKANLNYHHRTNEFIAHIYTNSQGFRVSRSLEEYSLIKDPRKFRIMLLGPSFAFGWGVDYEDTLAGLLKIMLDKDQFLQGKQLEIINAGVPSLTGLKQLQWFKYRGVQYKPNLVIQFIYGNMVVSNKHEKEYDVAETGYLIEKNMSMKEALRRKILRYSATVHYLWVAYSRVKGRINLSRSKNQAIIGAGRSLENYTTFDIRDPDIIESLGYYDELRSLCERINSHLLILHFPLSYCVHPEDAPRWEIYGVRDIQKQIRFNQSFCEYLNNRGFDCLNITSKLIQEAKERKERLYYYIDLHWTKKGNRIAAEETARHLSERWEHAR